MDKVRRSSRSRRPAQSIYDDALTAQVKEALGDASPRRRSPRKRDRDSDSEEEEEREEEVEPSESEKENTDEDSSSSSDDDDDDDNDEEGDEDYGKPAPKPKASPPKPKVGPGRRSVRFTRDTSFTTKAPASRSSASSLAKMAKKVLHKDETSENSLLAALLKTTTTRVRSSNAGDRKLEKESSLKELARRVIKGHTQDANKAQVDLFNLLFRSVGGRYDNLLDAEKIDLEDLQNDEWEEIIAENVYDMEMTPAENVLLCADPLGAVHAEGKKKAATYTIAPQEYRKLYSDFWYTLGAVAVSDSNQEDGSDRFQMEVARDVLHRIIEVTGVAQPDIRAAATLAVYQLAIAMLERLVELENKVEVADRQLNVARRTHSARKAQALTAQIDSWNRAIAELKENVEVTVVNAVFGERYKDRNMYIRALSLDTMATFAQISPHSFLRGSFLKYHGWMLVDKEAVVRISSLVGLTAPLRQDTDATSMRVVFDKFLPEIARRSRDVDLEVQERAMDLLLLLLREGFLDGKSPDDPMWNQVNLRALDPNTTPYVRKQALYFVVEQLDSFSDPESDGQLTESSVLAQIDDIAKWVSHTLSDSDVPVEFARYHIADLVVHSLRSMEDHSHLVTNWKAWLRALESDDKNPTEEDGKLTSIKKRVVLKMLVCAAEMEVQKSDEGSFMTSYLDPDLVTARNSSNDSMEATRKKGKKARVDDSSLEVLTDVLLGSLPDLIRAFRGENSILRSLTSLPQYLLPRQFSQPGKKAPFLLLMSRISEVFLESSDEEVLVNCSIALSTMAKHKHSRTDEALFQLKKVACSLRDRIEQLLQEKSELKHKGMESTGEAKEGCDLQYSVCFCMRRLAVLSRRWDIADLLGDDETVSPKTLGFGALCDAIGKDLASDLQARTLDEDGTLPEVWTSGDPNLHSIIADTVKEGLSFLLGAVAHRLQKAVGELGNEESLSDTDLENHEVLIMRARLLKLLALCFDQYFEPKSDDDAMDQYPPELHGFTFRVQQTALAVSSDLRSLFPKLWEEANSPFLRECALNWDHGPDSFAAGLIGGSIRFINSYEHTLRENDSVEEENKAIVKDLLLSQARGCLANWVGGHRSEGGILLAHLTGSGHEANRIILPVSRLMKKVNPSRLIEAHLKCLTSSYERWLDEEPFADNDRPTEEELEKIEEDERKFRAKYEALENLASRLSATLGVGRLSNKELQPLVERFIVKGIEYALDETAVLEEDYPGRRAAFLQLLTKYTMWIRKNPGMLKNIRTCFHKKEISFRKHVDFEGLDEADRGYISGFRKALGLKEWVDEVALARTRNDAHSHLSPLPEDDSDVDDSSPATKSSIGTRSAMSQSTRRTATSRSSAGGRSHFTVVDSDEESDGSQSHDPATKSSKQSVTSRSSTGVRSQRTDVDSDEESDGSQSHNHTTKSSKRRVTSRSPAGVRSHRTDVDSDEKSDGSQSHKHNTKSSKQSVTSRSSAGAQSQRTDVDSDEESDGSQSHKPTSKSSKQSVTSRSSAGGRSQRTDVDSDEESQGSQSHRPTSSSKQSVASRSAAGGRSQRTKLEMDDYSTSASGSGPMPPQTQQSFASRAHSRMHPASDDESTRAFSSPAGSRSTAATRPQSTNAASTDRSPLDTSDDEEDTHASSLTGTRRRKRRHT